MTSTFETRLGRCYELAFSELLTQSNATLIHGTIHRENKYPPNPHAWLRLANGWCWEPIGQTAMPEQAFNRYWGVVINHEYTLVEAAEKALRSKVYGPWRDDE